MIVKRRGFMKTLTKCVAGLLVLTVIGLYSPKVSFCDGSRSFVQTDKKPITMHEPKFMSESAKDIPLDKVREGEQKKLNWLMYGLGGALVVGLAVAAGGLSSGGDAPKTEKDDNTVTVEW
jgi:hypothetical protein